MAVSFENPPLTRMALCPLWCAALNLTFHVRRTKAKGNLFLGPQESKEESFLIDKPGRELKKELASVSQALEVM